LHSEPFGYERNGDFTPTILVLVAQRLID